LRILSLFRLSLITKLGSLQHSLEANKVTSTTPAFTAEALTAYLDSVFPEVNAGAAPGQRLFIVERVEPMGAVLRMRYDPRFLRPGGTLSGPSMFTLADLSLYAAVLGAIGPVALAVTTNLTINFLRKPEPADLIGTCRLLKLGKRLAVGDVAMTQAGASELVAHATGTYSIPADRVAVK
jgi:uncharacterized protein (TIGR00369 family)